MSISRDELKDISDISKINDIYHPRSIEEVQKIILYAKSTKSTVRTLGSQHSPIPAIYAEGEKQIKMMLDGSLREEMKLPKESKENDPALVRVGAGCYLGVNPKDSTSNLENSFNYQVDKKGFALPTLGGISHQTIAGFLSTSSSGGSAKHNIADSIEEIGFVDGTGQYKRVKKGEELFDAVGVSMGLLGVITDVTFRLPKRYLVKGSERNYEVDDSDSCLAGDSKSDYPALDKLLFKSMEYGHINWFAQKYVNRMTVWNGHTVSEEPIVPYKHALSSKAMALLASDVLLTTNILNETKGDSDKIQKVIGGMLKPFVILDQKQEFTDIWYKSLPIDDQAGVDHLISTSFCEVWFPRQQLHEVMRSCKDLFDKNPKAAGNFIVELYAAKKSPFWLSPSYGEDAFRVDLYWWDHNLIGNANQYFGQFYEKFKDISGMRFHWGKYLPHPGEKYGDYIFKAEHLYSHYPKINEFRKLRDEMDPDQIFLTDYWRSLLDISALKLTSEIKPSQQKSRTWGETAASVVEVCKSYVGFGLFSKKPALSAAPAEALPEVTLQKK